MYKKISIQELFIKLANPDQYGISRIVFTEEFCGVYSKLKTKNGTTLMNKIKIIL